MRIFHLSDLHIGARLYNRDLTEDHDYIFDQIIELAKEYRPDAMVIAGDVYDRAIPNASAVSTFNRLIGRLKREMPDMEVMMISGNHDSQARIDLFRPILSDSGIHMIGEPPLRPEEKMEKVILEDEFGKVNFFLLPFVKPSMVRPLAQIEQEQAGVADPVEIDSYQKALAYLFSREDVDQTERNVIVSHQFYLPSGKDPESLERSESEIKTIGNIDLVDSGLLSRFDYAALGHIHKPMKTGGETIRYCGSPLPLSLSESNQQKGILMVDLGPKGEVNVETIELHPKRKVLRIEDTVENLLEGYPARKDDYVSLVISDSVEIDMLDATERLRAEYPKMLDLSRKTFYKAKESGEEQVQTRTLSPYELCLEFAGLRGIEFSKEDLDLLKETINEVREVTE